MPASPDFVDHSLRDAMNRSWPGETPPRGLHLCLGAGAVSPPDWLCVDDNDDYPELTAGRVGDALRRCRGKLRADVTDLSWVPRGLAAVVYAHHVLEHVPVNKQAETLRLWASLVAPGGWLYLCQPDLDAICARTLEAAQPGAAEAWFAADPATRSIPGEEPGSRAGLPAGDLSEEMTSHYWLYLGGDHRSVPAESHIRCALSGSGLSLRRVRRPLSDFPPALRLFVSLEGCYLGKRTEAL